MEVQTLFDLALARCGPFETTPHLAIATSGGNDSMALTFLALDWSRRHQARITALIVDHHHPSIVLEDPAFVQELLKKYGVPTVVLHWQGSKKITAFQEQARLARYHLLSQWCAQNHVLHLLLGHHQEDQRETHVLRKARQSGEAGLAGMSTIVEKPYVRLLRPLLEITKKDLQDYLKAQQIPHFEDPSNHDLRFSRNQIRQHCYSRTEINIQQKELHRYGQRRQQQENEINEAISHCIEFFPEGYAQIHEDIYETLPVTLRLEVLQRCLMTFGIGHYPPRRESLIKCLQERTKRTTTLQGCILFKEQNRHFIAREPQKIAPLTLPVNVKTTMWDQRFQVSRQEKILSGSNPLILGPLGKKGEQYLKEQGYFLNLQRYPSYVRWGLPTLRSNNCIIEIFLDGKSQQTKFTSATGYAIRFVPRYSLTRFTFAIV